MPLRISPATPGLQRINALRQEHIASMPRQLHGPFVDVGSDELAPIAKRRHRGRSTTGERIAHDMAGLGAPGEPGPAGVG